MNEEACLFPCANSRQVAGNAILLFIQEIWENKRIPSMINAGVGTMINADASLALTAVAVSRVVKSILHERMGSNSKRTFDALLELDSRL